MAEIGDKIKVLIVDDHNLIAEAWSSILNAQSNVDVIGIEADEEGAFLTAKGYRPNIVLMDINLNQGDGFSCAKRITESMPKTKVIGLSIHDDLAMVKKMFNAGALGYLTKNSTTDELLEAFDKVFTGEKYICREIKEKYFNQLMGAEEAKDELTEREIEIVKLVAEGLKSKEIADKLEISVRTIDTHRHNILKKLNMNSSAQLIVWAKNKGYV